MTDLTVVDIIEQDHRAVAANLEKLSSSTLSDVIKNEVVQSLAQHSVAEELLIYPLVGEQASDGERLEHEARDEHQAIKEALVRFDRLDVDDADFPEAVRDLTAVVQAHVAEEEQEI